MALNLREKLVKATRLAIVAGSATAFAAGVAGCSTTGKNASGMGMNSNQAMSNDGSTAMGAGNACKGMAACKGHAQMKKSMMKKHMRMHKKMMKKKMMNGGTSTSNQSNNDASNQ